MNQNKKAGLIAFLVLLVLLSSALSFIFAYFYFQKHNFSSGSLINKSSTPEIKELPLQKYSIDNLAKNEFVAGAPIQAEKIIQSDEDDQIYTLLFTYQSQGQKISGALNFNAEKSKNLPTIVMVRGYVPLEIYYTGIGTKSAAKVFAENGYLTLAPDFLGFGESDNESEDSWEARFVKVISIVDLIKTVQAYHEINLSEIENAPVNKITLDPERIGIWGHSNGGQIAITTLEVLGQNLPATLWAPVLAPFPYSVLYFSDEYEDEGKETRKYVSLFEDDYDVFDFSLSKHLDKLNGPIQIQHGTADDSALISWTEEFLAKVDLENERRAALATESAELETELEKIEIDFYKYSGADHNLQPNWNQAVQRDLEFFAKYLKD